jgi:hypothetical protein
VSEWNVFYFARHEGLRRRCRHEAGERQVPGAGVGLAHNIGLGGAAMVTTVRAAGVGLD